MHSSTGTWPLVFPLFRGHTKYSVTSLQCEVPVRELIFMTGDSTSKWSLYKTSFHTTYVNGLQNTHILKQTEAHKHRIRREHYKNGRNAGKATHPARCCLIVAIVDRDALGANAKPPGNFLLVLRTKGTVKSRLTRS